MSDSILLGAGRSMLPVPGVVWRTLMRASARKARGALRFMTADHHRVRDFAVTELPRCGAPLRADRIAAAVQLSDARTREILDDLERHLTFLYRRDGETVSWAYPVTVEPTAHHAVLSSGEAAYSP